MECEICHKADATVHLTDVSNNAKKEIRLCQSCAKDHGVTIKSHMNKEPAYPDFQAHDLMAGGSPESDVDENTLECPNCGISYEKFRSTGKFGCPEDYRIFERQILQLLEKIHHKVHHTGKSPAKASQQHALAEKVSTLKDDLKSAIKLEQYEKAAEIRDKIYSLEERSIKSQR